MRGDVAGFVVCVGDTDTCGGVVCGRGAVWGALAVRGSGEGGQRWCANKGVGAYQARVSGPPPSWKHLPRHYRGNLWEVEQVAVGMASQVSETPPAPSWPATFKF